MWWYGGDKRGRSSLLLLVLLLLGTGSGALEDLNQLLVLGGELGLDGGLDLMKTGNLTGSVGEDADRELELSHESAVLVTSGLPSLAKFVTDGLGNADSDASLVIFRFAHGTNVERQDGVLLVDVSQKVTSVRGLEGVLDLDVTLVDSGLAFLFVVEINRLAFSSGDHDVDGKNMVRLEFEVILSVKLKSIGVDALHQDGAVGVDDVLLHLTGLGSNDGLDLVVVTGHLEGLGDLLTFFVGLDHLNGGLSTLPSALNNISTLVSDGAIADNDGMSGLADVAVDVATQIDRNEITVLHQGMTIRTFLGHGGIMANDLVDADAARHRDTSLNLLLFLLALDLSAVLVQFHALGFHVLVHLLADGAGIGAGHTFLDGELESGIANFGGFHVLLDDGLVGQVVLEVVTGVAGSVRHFDLLASFFKLVLAFCKFRV